MNPDLVEETIDHYYAYDKVDLSCEGFPGYTLTRNGKIWSQGGIYTKNGWMHVHPSKWISLFQSNGKARRVNINQLVSKYFIVPTMLSMPDKFKRLEGTPLIVSRYGVIFDSVLGRFRRPSRGGRYLHVKDGDKYYNVHRLVATLFVPNPHHKSCVNHIDSNRWNNDASNLEWCTQAENLKKAEEAGRMNCDKSKPSLIEMESEYYPKVGLNGKRQHPPDLVDLMVHVGGPNWPATK